MYALNTNQFAEPNLEKALKLYLSGSSGEHLGTTAIVIPHEQEPDLGAPLLLSGNLASSVTVLASDYSAILVSDTISLIPALSNLVGNAAAGATLSHAQQPLSVGSNEFATVWTAGGTFQTQRQPVYSASQVTVIQEQRARSAKEYIKLIVNKAQMHPSSEYTHPIPVDVITATAENAEIDTFLQDIYTLDTPETRQTAIDRGFDYIDRLCWKGAFSSCDIILRRADISRLSTSLMRSFLVITYAAKDKLTERDTFFLRVKEAMTREKGESVARRLLKNLV